VCDRLRGECERLGAEDGSVTVREADALDWLARPRTGGALPFDIVFVDPPHRLEVHHEAALRLEEHGWLAPDARVWFELVRRREPPDLPAGWKLLKSGRAGEVRYHLATRA